MKNQIKTILAVLTLFANVAFASPSATSNVKVYNLFSDSIPEAHGRTRICTMTINSPDEKIAFIDHSKKINESVDYVELVPNNKIHERNTWVDSVCEELSKKKVSCDKFVLSSHFGPRIYGDSKKDIDLDFLEAKSCSSTCSNLFAKVKETYLFACNSLSGTADDHRRSDSASGLLSSERNSTRQNYIAIQLEHDASRSWAEEAAEARYGDYSEGGSFGERFLQLFGNNVEGHQVYGFTSVSDRGSNNSQFIREAFAKHKPLEVVMQSQNMVKRSGFLSEDQQTRKKWTCDMLTKSPEEVAPSLVKEISIAKPGHRRLYGSVIRFMIDYFTPHHKYREDEIEYPSMAEHSWFHSLRSNEALKAFTAEALKTPNFPSSSRLRWSAFSYNLGWINQGSYYSNLSRGLYGLMKPPYNGETTDDVLHYAKLFPEVVDALGPIPSELKANPESRYRVEELLRSIHGL